MKSQQSPKTLQFQRSKFNIRNSLRGITCEIECGLSDAASEGWTQHLWAAGHAAVPLGGGLAGLRDDAPSEARGADGERAGRPRGGRRSVGATSNSSRRGRRAGGPPPTGTHSGRALRRPERQRRHTKHSTGARARRPAPLDATTQTRQLRSTDVPCRSARAARRSRRSSRNPRLRRRAGPRR